MTDPRPTLVYFGAPLMWVPRRQMDLEDAVVGALALLAEDATLLLALPVVLSMNEASVKPAKLLREARRLGVQAELGMVLELTAELAGASSLGALASSLHRVAGEPRYLQQRSSPLARQAADERTPPVVARWGFRVNMPESSLRQFFAKHHG